MFDCPSWAASQCVSGAGWTWTKTWEGAEQLKDVTTTCILLHGCFSTAKW